jgi:hypothetical protein
VKALLRSGLSLVLGLSVLALSGCGGQPPVLVTGKVVKNGQQWKLSDKGMFVVTFREQDDKKHYATDAKPDGTFTIMGPQRKGIPLGKYKVEVQAFDPYDKRKDLLDGKFTPGKSTLVVEITGPEVTVDVGK